eukprot:Em0006g1311a
MAKEVFKVGVLHSASLGFEESSTLEAYELTGDQVCRLLDTCNTTDASDSSGNGFVQSRLGVSPLQKYEVTCGGRSGLYRISREEVESIMQKVQILIVLSWMDKLIMYRAILDYVMYMSCEKLINNCSAIVIRVFQHPEKTLPASMPSVTSILSIAGIDTVKFAGKMHVIIDPKSIHSKRDRKKKAAVTQLTADIERVKSTLGIKGKVEEIVHPVKETVSAGKALLSGGQKLVSWVGGLFKT